MSGVALNLPWWGEWLVSVLLVVGALLTLIGTIGLVRLRNFYQRIHAPTLGSTLATWMVAAASALAFSLSHQRLIFHEILIGVLFYLTAPITAVLLVRAALHHDRRHSSSDEDRPRGMTDTWNE